VFWEKPNCTCTLTNSNTNYIVFILLWSVIMELFCVTLNLEALKERGNVCVYPFNF
jgi:hypothetical protein